MLLDLTNASQTELSYDSLPGFDEDVLASVKAENAKREGKTYQSKKAPRAIELINDWSWKQSALQSHNSGSQVAVMLKAWDNKDRWLATVDFAKKRLINQHRLHDDAWINYSFNDFGWLSQKDTLYYLSEESGYAHLYVKPVNAAGNGAASNGKYTGLAPNADIVVVKAGNGSFDTSNIIIALDYLKNLSTSLGKPIVVNMSLGSQYGAHDGTDPLERAIDTFTDTAAGRIVVVASGNDNGDNIHKRLVLAPGGTETVTLQVPTTTTTSSTDVFQFTSYGNDTSALSVVVTAPDGTQAVSNAGTSVMNGNAKVYMYNFIDPESGDRKVQVYVTRTTTSTDVAGSWNIAITNSTTSTLTVDGWLDTKGDDYSGMTVTGGDSNYLVTIPGCATKAITVGSYIAKLDWFAASGNGYNYTVGMQDGISAFSSVGPRRDNVIKPNSDGALWC